MTVAATTSPGLRALPLLALAVSGAMLLALGICLDALVLHEVAWPVLVLAFTGGAIALAAVLRAGARALMVLRAARHQHRRLAHAGHAPGRPGVLLLEDLRPGAWCAGLVRPSVVVTTGAVAALSPAALDAVVAHERHHARRRDGLRRSAAEVIAAGLFLLPGAARAGERYGTALELGADRAAAALPGGGRGLASAMLALDEPGRGVDPVRVDHLLGRPVRLGIARSTLSSAAWLLLLLAATTVGCTLATGCVDIFWLQEEDATASRVGLLPPLVLAAAVLAARATPCRAGDRILPEPV